MRIRRSPGLRNQLAAALSLLLAATAAGALSAGPARATVGPPGQSYALNLSTDPASTDYDHRTVDLTGVLTTADGTPVPNGSVVVSETLIFDTWNPWGDPIDPYSYESRPLGTVPTDQDGRFALPGTLIDHVGTSTLARSAHYVELDAEYDPDGDPATYNSVYDRTVLHAAPVPTTLTYKVSGNRVHEGDVLTVTGTVGVAPGHGSLAGTQVFLRAYWEAQSNAMTTTDAAGRFTFRYKVGRDDYDFAIFSAPLDYYLAGTEYALPVHRPLPFGFSALSATVDRNGLATVRATVDQACGVDRQAVVVLQFAKEGSTAWRTVGKAVTDAKGVVRATYKGGNGRYRWLHAETDDCLGATSAARAVHRTPTRIVGFHGTPQPVRKGHRERLTGTLQFLDGHTWKNRGRHAVEIWYRPTTRSAWVRTAVIESSARGAFQKTFTATADGWWRAVQVGSGSTYTAVSASDWIDVR